MPPLLTVVVSTYERPEGLARLLAGLRAQTVSADRFEVIVVDNGSGPATAAVLADEQRRGRLDLKTVRHEQTLGPAGGRNSGWERAAAPLVVFTDDDCVPGPGWLAAVEATASGAPGAIVQGRTLPDPEGPDPRAPLVRTVSVTQLGPQYETCNIAYPRALLEELGGFDPAYGLRPAGEDTDLAWRALERGTLAVFAPDALVFHAVERLSLADALRYATRWGATARLFARHPQTRVILYRRFFWNVWHYLLLRSLLALRAPGWLRRLVLARYLLVLLERGRASGDGVRAVPVLLAIDLVEIGSLAHGAIRHRTFVL